MSITADLTPVGPYRTGQTVLLVVNVNNLDDRPVEGLTVASQASNLTVDPLWGGCDSAPCPPFVLPGLKQKQFTLPATITDAGQPIFDVVTVSGGGIARQAVVRIAPPEPSVQTPQQAVATMPGRPETFSVQVGEHMTVALQSDAGFQVAREVPKVAAPQLVSLAPPYPYARWQWRVRAVAPGAHTLTIVTEVGGFDRKNKYHSFVTTPRAYTFYVGVDPIQNTIYRLRIWLDGLGIPPLLQAITGIVGGVAALIGAILGLRKPIKTLWGTLRRR